ncbi:VPLPA-CTERM sorting domain-containing protein [Cereibacter sp. SYSU M97828]|nr:VPLPA-CTERM sorting domain-containing protein [Cereibacter flavus]
MNTGLILSVAVVCAGAGFFFGLEACAKADTVGPDDPGTTPCILSIDWTTQRQAPAVYPAKAVEALLTPPVIDSPDITTTTLLPLPGGGGSWLQPAPVPLPAAGLLLGAAVIGLGVLARRRRG